LFLNIIGISMRKHLRNLQLLDYHRGIKKAPEVFRLLQDAQRIHTLSFSYPEVCVNKLHIATHADGLLKTLFIARQRTGEDPMEVLDVIRAEGDIERSKLPERYVQAAAELRALLAMQLEVETDEDTALVYRTESEPGA